MTVDDVESAAPSRHGAYLCLTVPRGERRAAASLPVDMLAGNFGLRNEFDPGDDHPADAIAFLRGSGAAPADIADPGLLNADAVIHVASADAALVAQSCAELARLLSSAVKQRVLTGVVRPMIYTGTAMYDFAYAQSASTGSRPVSGSVPAYTWTRYDPLGNRSM